MKTVVMPLVISTVLCASLLGCGSSAKGDMEAVIRSSCGEVAARDTCKVNMGQVGDFSWDTMYVFSEMTFPEVISDAIGRPCRCDVVPDGHTRLLFVNDSAVVHIEDYDSGSDRTIQFRSARDSNGVVMFPRDQFTVRVLMKRNAEGNVFYDVYPFDS